MTLGMVQAPVQRPEITLSAQMIQQMEFLNLTLVELEERIERELDENESLERVDVDASGETFEIERDAKSADDKQLIVDEAHNKDDFERLYEFESELPDDNFGGGRASSGSRIEAADRAHAMVANIEGRSQTLHEYLMEQFAFARCDDETRAFGEYLIQNLDANGRVPGPLAEIVALYRISGRRVMAEQAEEALGRIQQLDPKGVGARDLAECLRLQIRHDTPHRKLLVKILSSHFDDFLNNRLPVIQRKTGHSLDEINAAISELRHFNFRPGSGFEQRPVEQVTPELIVERDESGWVVSLIDEYVPSLRISPRYRRMLHDKPDPATREWIKSRIEAARWVVAAIEQRNETLKRIAQAIVDHQMGFLEHGPEAIAPLKMEQVAEAVGRHVTTVSRAVKGPYIQTPRGIFPLRGFFVGGTQTCDGEDVAWVNVRGKLREIVDLEDKKKPLSDARLVMELTKHGFKVSRRTVTKYREKLGILASRRRREY